MLGAQSLALRSEHLAWPPRPSRPHNLTGILAPPPFRPSHSCFYSPSPAGPLTRRYFISLSADDVCHAATPRGLHISISPGRSAILWSPIITSISFSLSIQP